MIVRVEHNHGDHINFYEGNHVGIHKALEAGEKQTEGLQLIVESGNQMPVTIELAKDNMTRVFIMNDNGKTIDKIYL